MISKVMEKICCNEHSLTMYACIFLLFYLFYRLEDLVAHEDIISILTKLIDSDNLPHLLLYGPPGTGKVRADLDLLMLLSFVIC
jgi:hypothetical protein